jgi:diguanylate cyclase (GGDEF)-like protein/PAS domain S-box-containing protein
MLEKAVEAVPLGVTIASPVGTILYTNPAEAEMHGYGVEELRGERTGILGIPARRTPIQPERIRSWTRQSVNLRRDGSTFPVLLHSQPVTDPEGRVLGMVTCSWELTERRRMEEMLLRNAFYDPLTRLPTRTLFVERLAHALLRAERGERSTLAVLFLDVDRLELVNSGLGHEAGDELLVAIARRLRSSLRPGDTVARVGGDEFAVLLEGIEGAGDVHGVAARIRTRVSAPVELGGHEAFPSVSMGVALGSAAESPPEHLLRNAETAMYRAREGRKGWYELYEEAMQAEALERLRLETSLRRAVERGELRLHYQPVVSLESGRIAGFEALVRWEHTRRGLILPGEFIPLAEESEVIVPLGGWVLREAARQLRGWQSRFPRTPPLFMQVNVSARQLSRPGLVEAVEEALRETELHPHTLRLEVTESAVMENTGAAAATLSRLKALGVPVHLDDFGTGYSSLSYLHRLPFDTLKIDRSFVSGGDGGESDRRFLRAIVDLAHDLGVDVVAEGVETPEQLDAVRALGCEYAQGYLFSRPVREEEAGGLLAANLAH